jgi:hypothetical protein
MAGDGHFVEARQWRGRGAPRVDVPQKIKDLLEETYRQGTVRREPVDEHEGEALGVFIRLIRAHARHRGLRAHHQLVREEDGQLYVQFRMAAPRPYTSLPREKRH